MKRILLITGILTPLLFSYAYPSETVRYLLAVGANNGGEKREVLRFAVSDAQSFSRIMNQLGGIPPERTTVLIDPKPDQFAAELTRLGKQIAEESKGIRRTEVIFYYSGHSDEEGLLLGSKSFDYKDLRTLIQQLPADVKIAILDSCSSGAFTRIKGGKKLTPFMSDASQDMRGFAFMTSSSADEVSQESDRIGGSFFTHYLISGLRGAADGKRDGQITLNEAYQYAYRETLTRTARTAGGAQHPNYNIQMTGTGDVILTDIRSGGALLTLGDSLDGRFFVNSGTNLVAEFTKQKGDALSFSLAEGKYSIVRDSDGSLSETKCVLKKNSTFEAWERSFTPIEKESSVQRGVKPSFYSTSPFAAYLLPLKGSGDEKTIEHFQLYFIGSQCAKVEGLSVGIGVGVINEDLRGVSLSAIGSVVGKDSSVLQAATVFTYTGANFSGVQAAGVCAFSGGTFKGVQGATAVAYNGGDFKGVQSSGILNMTAGHFYGLQTSSAFNFAGEGFTGMQASVVNYSAGEFSGFQLGVVNIANDIGGFQLGVLNLTKKFDSGLQLGVINYAQKTDGVPIGVFNYFDEADGYPIGLITIVRNGETHANVVMEENGFSRTTLTHGTRKFYNIYSFGYRADGKESSTGLGFGRKFESGNLFFAVEGIVNSIVKSSETASKELYNQNQLKLTVGYMFFSHLSVFAGVSLNHYVSSSSQRDGINPPLIVWENKYNKVGPGFYVGVRF